MKKRILGALAFISFCFMGGQAETWYMQLLGSGISLLIFAYCVSELERMGE